MSEISSKTESFLVFKLYKELFAVSIHKVLEVLLDYNIVIVPDAPVYIAGMLNFRGDIIPVINLNKKFNFPEQEIRKKVIIVLEISVKNNHVKFGALVDGVKDVLEITETDIKPIPEFGSKYNPEYLTGMIFSSETYFMILDIEKIFSDKEVEMITENYDD